VEVLAVPSARIGQTPPKVIREQGFPFLTEAVPEARVLVLKMFDLDEYVHEALPSERLPAQGRLLVPWVIKEASHPGCP